MAVYIYPLDPWEYPIIYCCCESGVNWLQCVLAESGHDCIGHQSVFMSHNL